MIKRKVRKVLLNISFLFALSFLYPVESVDFFATVTSSKDSAMIKMTTDLFFMQFQSIGGYTVNDRRQEEYNPSEITSNISFFAEINEDDEGGWICCLNAITSNKSGNVSLTKKYDSYHRILLDAKASLENLLNNLAENMEGSPSSKEDFFASDAVPSNIAGDELIETIAGTWKGEEMIEKVLLLRGGKGFVIYKNGASMNVDVTASGNSVRIVQNCKPNASFFPEIPRQDALKKAADAEPIEWNLMLYGDTLHGKKTTLTQEKGAGSKIERGDIEVTWTKR